MFFHVDQADRDGLPVYAHEENMVSELKEIGGYVGTKNSKHKLKKRSRPKPERSAHEDVRNAYILSSDMHVQRNSPSGHR